MSHFLSPKAGSGGVNLRSQPFVDTTTRVGAIAEGVRLELDRAGADWHACKVYVSTQGALVRNGKVVLRPNWFAVNIRLAPTINDATDVGDLTSGQQLELIAQQGDWLIARVYASAQFTDVTNAINPAPPTIDFPATNLISAAELAKLKLAPARPRSTTPGQGQNHFLAARVWNRYGGVIEPLAAKIGIDEALAVAVVAVESGGNGIAADGRMVIRFENHLFWHQWGKTNAAAFQALFAFDANVTWQNHKFRPTPGAAWQDVHANQNSEWSAFAVARNLNDHAAKLSISMGLAQVVGFNFKRLGYASVEAMFDALSKDERLHVLSLFSFIAADAKLVQALQQGDLLTFASGYNGPGQASFYASLIAAARTAFGELAAPARSPKRASVPARAQSKKRKTR